MIVLKNMFVRKIFGDGFLKRCQFFRYQQKVVVKQGTFLLIKFKNPRTYAHLFSLFIFVSVNTPWWNVK